MSLCKTAQLNVYELLKYLDYDNLNEAMEKEKRLQKMVGKRMMNARPR